MKTKHLTTKDQHELLHLLETIRETITPETDVIWAGYDSVEQLLEALNHFTEKIQEGETTCLDELSIAFAPTSSFQELSIQNGWSDEYLKLAVSFDRIYENYN